MYVVAGPGTTVPVDAAVGAGAEHGKARTSQEVPGPTLVQFNTAVVSVTGLAMIAVGFGQTGGGSQVTLAVQPAWFTDPSLRKTNVKHPSALDEVNGPGIVPPQYPPGRPPGTFAAGFVLAISGADVEEPSYTYKAS